MKKVHYKGPKFKQLIHLSDFKEGEVLAALTEDGNLVRLLGSVQYGFTVTQIPLFVNVTVDDD